MEAFYETLKMKDAFTAKDFMTIIPFLMGSVRYGIRRDGRSGDGAGGETGMRRTIDETQARSLTGAFHPEIIHTGTFTRTVAAGSGTQVITGIPLKPFMIFFLAASATLDGQGGSSIGFDFDPATGLDAATLFRILGAELGWGLTTSAIRLFSSSGNEFEGSISAVSKEGFDFTWTMTGTPQSTAEVSFVAFRKG